MVMLASSACVCCSCFCYNHGTGTDHHVALAAAALFAVKECNWDEEELGRPVLQLINRDWESTVNLTKVKLNVGLLCVVCLFQKNDPSIFRKLLCMNVEQNKMEK